MMTLLLALALCQENEDHRRRIDGWIESLGIDDPIRRSEAQTRLDDLWKDVRFALPELEGARASAKESVRRRSDRIVRSLRQQLEISPVHSSRPEFGPDDLEVYDFVVPGPGKRVLEFYDIHDHLGRLDASQFLLLVKEIPEIKGTQHTVEVTPEKRLVVVAPAEVHRAIRTFLGDRVPAKREGVAKDVERLGDPEESVQEAAEARLTLLGRQVRYAEEALKRREGAGELDVRDRIAALLRKDAACRKALSGHEGRRRAVLARLQAEGELLEGDAIPDLVRGAVEPCVVSEVRFVARPDKVGSDQARSGTFWIVLKKTVHTYVGDPPPATTVGIPVRRKGGAPAMVTINFER
jgi:hypothetical protein